MRRAMMVAVLGLGLAAGAMGLAWAANVPAANPAALAGLDARAAVQLANEWAARGEKVQSFITTQALHFQWPDGRQAVVNLDPGEVYVAIAPYVRRTHPCQVHYLSSCRGELPGRRFAVEVTTLDGKPVYQGEVVTLFNGFFELWLPRGLDLVIRVQGRDGLSGEATGIISTRPDAPTCITTLRLS